MGLLAVEKNLFAQDLYLRKGGIGKVKDSSDDALSLLIGCWIFLIWLFAFSLISFKPQFIIHTNAKS